MVGLAGCSGSSSAPTPTTTSPSTTPTTAPSATPSPAQALQQLARAAASASYRATYAAHQRHPAGNAVWKVWRTPALLRVDVITRHVTSTLIVTPRASFSCRAARHRKTCFRVAGAGKPVTDPLQLLAQKLFSTDLAYLAGHASAFTVTAAPALSGSPAVPASACFAVRPKAGTARPRVERATYCFTPTGVLTRATYPSGNYLRLLHLSTGRPPRAAFVPYASPTPLP